MGKLFLLVGPPGSGKSTFIKKYLEEPPGQEYIICSADHHFETLAKQRKEELTRLGDPEAANVPDYMFDYMQLRNAHMNCQNKAVQALEQEIPLIFIDNTNTTEKERRFYVQAALHRGYEISIKVLDGKFKNVHNVPDDKVEQMRLRIDLQPGTYSVSMDPEDVSGRAYKTTQVFESVQFIKLDKINKPTLPEVSADIARLKEKITAIKIEYPEDTDREIAEALDDMTGALDVAQHHVEDISMKIEGDK